MEEAVQDGGGDDVIEHAAQYRMREMAVRAAQRAIEHAHPEVVDERHHHGVEELVCRQRHDRAAQQEVERDAVEISDGGDGGVEDISGR